MFQIWKKISWKLLAHYRKKSVVYQFQTWKKKKKKNSYFNTFFRIKKKKFGRLVFFIFEKTFSSLLITICLTLQMKNMKNMIEQKKKKISQKGGKKKKSLIKSFFSLRNIAAPGWTGSASPCFLLSCFSNFAATTKRFGKLWARPTLSLCLGAGFDSCSWQSCCKRT